MYFLFYLLPLLHTRSSVIGGHFHQVGGAGMGVSHCVVLRRVLHQVVSGLIGRINKCVLLGGTCPTGPPPTMGGGRGHLVREEELGLAELKVTLVIFVLLPWCRVVMVTPHLLHLGAMPHLGCW